MKNESSYENHVKMLNRIMFMLILYYFHIFLHSWARDPGLGPKAAAGRARAGPLPPLWGLGLGPGPNDVEKYENNIEQV